MTSPRAVFSVDVEDWYQGIELPQSAWQGKEDRLRRGLDRILELLRSREVRGTFFILGWIAKEFPAAVRSISEAGHEVASHGFSHAKVYDLSREAFREEVRATRLALEDACGARVIAHRSPFFSVTRRSLWALDILREEGYQIDSSVSPAVTWRYGIAGSPQGPYIVRGAGLVEFPVTTFGFLSHRLGVGGAYFRIFPYRLLARGLRESLAEHGTAMFYSHPWEYDPGHPVSDEMEWKAKLTHYWNLGGMAARTERLLSDFSFCTMAEAVSDLKASGRLREVELA